MFIIIKLIFLKKNTLNTINFKIFLLERKSDDDIKVFYFKVFIYYIPGNYRETVVEFICSSLRRNNRVICIHGKKFNNEFSGEAFRLPRVIFLFTYSPVRSKREISRQCQFQRRPGRPLDSKTDQYIYRSERTLLSLHIRWSLSLARVIHVSDMPANRADNSYPCILISDSFVLRY